MSTNYRLKNKLVDSMMRFSGTCEGCSYRTGWLLSRSEASEKIFAHIKEKHADVDVRE